MPVYPYHKKLPTIAPKAFIAPSADVIGDVVIGEETGVWFGCVIRGDVNHIRIGSRTNIQDGTVIHVTRPHSHQESNGGGFPTIIGSGVTIGHQCLLHGCTVEDDAFIGMAATLMDGSYVERHGFLAAGSLLTPGKRVKSGELWVGSPARLMRPISDAERAFIPVSAANYVEHAREYLDM